MADKLTPAQRSQNMARVRSKNTRPELLVRRRLHEEGYRFRLHRADLPGRPDFVLPRYKTAVFVNGCFWHGHDCKAARRPTTNVAFWNEKIEANIARDESRQAELAALGWSVALIWTCSLEPGIASLLDRLRTARPNL